MSELRKLIFLECWYATYMSARCPHRSRLTRRRFYNEHVLKRKNV